MSFEILNPVRYGKDGKRYKLAQGEIVAKSFFSSKDAHTLWQNGFIKKSKEKPSNPPNGDEAPVIGDLSQMTVVQAKEFLEMESHVDMLEKYLDQANAEEFPRVSITKFIERRVKELTGFK